MKLRSTSAKAIALLICASLGAGTLSAQEPELTETQKLELRTQNIEDALKALQKLKVSGYIQAQYQWGEEDAALKVGNPVVSEDPGHSFSRIGIRRGRIKFAYEGGIASGVFQLDMTDKTFGVKDVYLQIKDPWVGTNSFKAGIFDRPFGNEISYSSSRRESPERSTIFQTLFPEERDLGGMLTLQASKTSPWNILKLEGGLFAGNGIKAETDSKRDFIGHLSASKNIGSEAKFGLGVSYYYGYVFQGTANVYKMDGEAFTLNSDAENKGRYARRQYFGVDGQFSIMSLLGLTQLRAEYLWGTQPGGPASSKSPNSGAQIITDTYIRDFSGGYAIFVQDLGKTPFSVVLKYDWYDPNTKVSGNGVGVTGSNTTAVDLSQSTFGFGAFWRASAAIRLTAYYEINKNEKTDKLPVFAKDLKNNVFTCRLQYKF